jgi:glycosyltransferase involved in cell wall biosynthesis
VKTWHVLRYLVGCGHEVCLASFVRPDEEAFVPVLRELCVAVHTVPIHRSRLADVSYWLRSHFSGRPFLIERDDSMAMRRLVCDLLANEYFDVVHADQLTMSQFALAVEKLDPGRRPSIIFDAHNATWSISARMSVDAPWFLRPVLRLESERIKRYEGMLVERFDHTMVVIGPDRDALLQGVSNGCASEVEKRITVIPITVDTDVLQPIHRKPDSLNVVTLGSLNYPPNADGIRWFLRDVFPLVKERVPEVTLTVIGKSPPADFLQLSEREPDTIRVTGYVPDLTPYLERAALMVVPVRAGSGMRVRLLDAFARAMPVVTTTIGLEGIQAINGQEVLVADGPVDFAEATVRLLHDQILQNFLAENGRALAERQYDWRTVLKEMDVVYARARGAI